MALFQCISSLAMPTSRKCIFGWSVCIAALECLVVAMSARTSCRERWRGGKKRQECSQNIGLICHYFKVMFYLLFSYVFSLYRDFEISSEIDFKPENCAQSRLKALVCVGQVGRSECGDVISPTVQADCADCSRKHRTSQRGPASSHGGRRD